MVAGAYIRISTAYMDYLKNTDLLWEELVVVHLRDTGKLDNLSAGFTEQLNHTN